VADVFVISLSDLIKAYNFVQVIGIRSRYLLSIFLIEVSFYSYYWKLYCLTC